MPSGELTVGPCCSVHRQRYRLQQPPTIGIGREAAVAPEGERRGSLEFRENEFDGRALLIGRKGQRAGAMPGRYGALDVDITAAGCAGRCHPGDFGDGAGDGGPHRRATRRGRNTIWPRRWPARRTPPRPTDVHFRYAQPRLSYKSSTKHSAARPWRPVRSSCRENVWGSAQTTPLRRWCFLQLCYSLEFRVFAEDRKAMFRPETSGSPRSAARCQRSVGLLRVRAHVPGSRGRGRRAIS